jgi:hypothetical protein
LNWIREVIIQIKDDKLVMEKILKWMRSAARLYINEASRKGYPCQSLLGKIALKLLFLLVFYAEVEQNW